MISQLIPYSAYKDSGVPWLGEVPEHWEVSRLKTRLHRNDAGVWGDDFDENGTPVLRSTEQTISGGWRISTPARIRLSQSQRNSALLLEGDLVVTKSSGSPAHIGKTSLVTRDIAAMHCCHSNFMQRLRPNGNTLSAMIWHLLNSPVGREQMVFQSTTTTGLGNLNGTILGNCVLAFPPLLEQASIVRFLDHVDRRIQRYIGVKQKLIKLLEEQKQAIIHRAITRGLDHTVRLKPSGVKWLGDIPEHWEIKRLRYLIEGKLTYGANVAAEYTNFEWPRYLRITDFGGDGTLRNDTFRSLPPEIAKDYLVQAGDILLARSGATVGKAFLVVTGAGETCHAGYLIRARPRRKVIESEFLFAFTQSAGFGRWKDSTLIIATIQNIGADKYANLYVPLPPIREQHEIIRFLREDMNATSSAIDRARHEMSLLREYRTRLIADLVTGKLDVREAAAHLPDEATELGPIDEADAPIDAQEETDVGEEQEE